MGHWIMTCVATSSFSLSINGSLHGFFAGKRGLRQRDSLSPYLFTLVMEVLTLTLRRWIRESADFTYHPKCEGLDIVNLCFADGLFIFLHSDVNSANVIMETHEEFKHALGLAPSIPKRKAFFCNVLNYVMLPILNVLPFEEGSFPVKYLGVPLVSTRLVNRDCCGLIERVRNRLSNWKNKFLSFAGRLQLVQSASSSMHVYWATMFMLPDGVIKKIEPVLRKFLWPQGSLQKGKSKVAWDVVCLPKNEGGLGIHSLHDLNISILSSANYVSFAQMITNAANTLNACVGDIVSNEAWSWPNEWSNQFLNLAALSLVNNVADKWVWKDRDGRFIDFLWQIVGRLFGQGVWKLHGSLLFGFPIVWSDVCGFTGNQPVHVDWESILVAIISESNKKTIDILVMKLIFAATSNFIWQERNARLFRQEKRPAHKLTEIKIATVRMKLISMKFKKNNRVLKHLETWKRHLGMSNLA
uniref:uncharacterized protein LOC122583648 n=1 Tax=Erigeron canadensis TaxID=72917 RepID=UPI001CB9C162|nr:uncharacterized protein LOC122583648 [Erigeron canadensis]